MEKYQFEYQEVRETEISEDTSDHKLTHILYFYSKKKREAGAALLQPPRESVDCSFHPAVRSAGSSCSSKADTIAT